MKYTQPKPGPVRTGQGVGDVSTQARNFTSFALTTIDTIARTTPDEKLRFAAARYLIELGWGRPAAMKPVDSGDGRPDGVTDDDTAQLYAFIDEIRAKRLDQEA